ncbi:MAG: elongation factor Ts, partial [Synechococcus sp. SB0662_bin_45]|nr:elongation factor Ts [Synechococcus sp. SB0662_bin_45]
DPSLSVADRVKQTSGKLGEKIVVRRFARFVLGQGIEVAATDFAAEVAAMTTSG